MYTDDNPRAEVKKSIVLSEKLKMAIGFLSILAVVGLAGLVFRQYEAGIPPDDAAPTSANRRFIRVTISEPNPAIGAESSPGASRHAARTQEVP